MENKVKNEEVSVLPDVRGLMRNFSHRTYNSPYDALQEIIDNSFQAIRKKYKNLPETCKPDFCGHIRLEFDKKTGTISTFDNGCGMDKEGIVNCVSLGRSDFRSDGEISNFGAGATAASLSLSGDNAEVWFTSCVDEKFLSMEGGPRGTNESFKSNLTHGGEEDLGTHSHRLREFLKNTSSDSGTLATSTPSRQKSYSGGTMKKQLIHRNAGIFHNLPFPIKFDLFGDSFDTTEESPNKADSLVHPNHETTFFLGGPNFEYDMLEFEGNEYGIRCSAALGYDHSKESDFWQFNNQGHKFNQPQMTYHTFNGRVISSRADGAKYFKTHGTKRSFALEVMTTKLTEDFRINPEKTAEITSERFQKHIEKLIKPYIKKVTDFYSQYSNRDIDRNERQREDLQSASSAIVRSMRKKSTSLLGGEAEKPDGSSKKRNNKSYVGKSNDFRPNDESTPKRRSEVIYEAFHDTEDRDLIHDILDDREDGKIIFRVNTANEYVQSQIASSETRFDFVANNLFPAAIAAHQTFNKEGLQEPLSEHYRTIGRNYTTSMKAFNRQKKGK